VDPPPRAVLLTNIPPLTQTAVLRAHYRTYGSFVAFEWQIDQSNGAALGVLFVRFANAADATKCVKGEDGRRPVFGVGVVKTANGKNGTGQGDGDDESRLRAVLDGEGKVLKAVLKELEARKNREREERRRREKGLPPLTQNQTESGAGSIKGSTGTDQGQTPSSTQSQTQGSRGAKQPSHPASSSNGGPPVPSVAHPSLPLKPLCAYAPSPHLPLQNGSSTPSGIASLPPNPNRAAAAEKDPIMKSAPQRKPPVALIRARQQVATRDALQAVPMAGGASTPLYGQEEVSTPSHHGGRSTPGGAKRSSTYRINHRVIAKERGLPSRSPSPPYYSRDRDCDTWLGRDRSWERRGGDRWEHRDDSWSRSPSRSRSRDRNREWTRDRDRDRDGARGKNWDRDRSPDRRGRRERERERDRERGEKEKAAQREKHEGIIGELVKNGKEHVRLPLVGSSVQEEDVKSFFADFKVDKVCVCSLHSICSS
jgi:hypothetical protein